MRFLPQSLIRLPSSVLLGVAILPLLAITGMYSAPAFLGGGNNASVPTNSSDWYTVEQRSFDLSLIASGELEARKQDEIKSKVGGTTRIVWLVEEGIHVEKGDRLASLAAEQVTERLENAMLDLESTKTDLSTAEQSLLITQYDAETNRRDAEVKLALAELELAKWTEGDIPQQRRDLKLKLETAQRNLERYKRDLELSKQLYDEKFISLGEYEDDEIRVIEAENNLATAKLALEVFQKYTLPKERRKFTSDVEQAKANLERTLRKNETELSQAQSRLESRKRRLRIRQERVKDLETQKENTTIYAPQDGMVVYATSVGPRWRRNDPLSEGREVRYDETLFLLPDTSEMVGSMRVHEAVLPRVKVGQTVNMTIDARPDEVIQAEVISIAIMAEDGGWLNPELREYIVRAALPEGVKELKPAMRCTGEIIVGQVIDQLAVPIQAVFVEGEQRFVYVESRGGVKAKPVEIGRASETFVEVASGLEAGDRVLLRAPEPFELAG